LAGSTISISGTSTLGGVTAATLDITGASRFIGAVTVSGVSNLAGVTAARLNITGNSKFTGTVNFSGEATHGTTANFTAITATSIVATDSIRIGAVLGGGSSIVVAGVSTLEGVTANYLHVSAGITAIGNLTVKGNTTLVGVTASALNVSDGITAGAMSIIHNNYDGWLTLNQTKTSTGKFFNGIKLKNPNNNTATMIGFGQFDYPKDLIICNGNDMGTISFGTPYSGLTIVMKQVGTAMYLGVGTASPTVALDVAGIAKASGWQQGAMTPAVYIKPTIPTTAEVNAAPQGTV